LKNNANSQAQIDELTKVIEENEDRIDNLIRSLNVLLEKNEKKQQVIERLQERVNSITNYH
jgi:phosphoenolpyruvate carboxylase